MSQSNVVKHTLRYEDQTHDLYIPTSMSQQEINRQIVNQYPALSTGVMHISEDKVITFTLPSGNKA